MLPPGLLLCVRCSLFRGRLAFGGGGAVLEAANGPQQGICYEKLCLKARLARLLLPPELISWFPKVSGKPLPSSSHHPHPPLCLGHTLCSLWLLRNLACCLSQGLCMCCSLCLKCPSPRSSFRAFPHLLQVSAQMSLLGSGPLSAPPTM